MSAAERPALNLPGRVDGIDVSSVQSSIDYRRVAAEGFRFAIVKVSEGLAGRDSCAAKHLDGFRSAGMYAIPYHFLHPSQGAPELQVRNLVRQLGDTWPGRVCLDIETRQAPESNAELVRFLELAVEECMRWGSLAPAIYTYPDFARRLQPELGASTTLGGCPLWLAEYGSAQPWVPPWGYTPHAPAPWHAATLHQYSGGRVVLNGQVLSEEGYRVPGIFGACDRDLFLGVEADLRAWLGLPDIHEADTMPALPDVESEPSSS